MKFDLIAINKVKPNPENPRFIKDAKFNLLVNSIKKSPWMLNIRPIVVNSERIVLGGNMRLKACIEAGLTEVPIIYADNLSEEQQREFIIKDNLGYGEWDFDELKNDWDIDQLEEWGLDLPPLKEGVSEVEPNDASTIETSIQLGDLIEIGPHRLVCGDSTRVEHVDLLLGGATPELMVTDPPYGVKYDAGWREERGTGGRAVGKVANDDISDWSNAWSLSPAKVAYVYHAGKYTHIVARSLEDNDFELRSQIIWVKNNFAISRGDYHWKHEPCWYAVKKGHTSNWAGARDQSTVWEIDKPQKSETGHSTQKPVECMANAIRNHTGNVYDPFLGSGTTMVAAHQLGRRCFGIEITPAYCQIIVDRMRKLAPDLVIKINGVVWGL